ncbi:MAG: helix-turn-helix domain-containing protein [Bacteroidales bacterium]
MEKSTVAIITIPLNEWNETRSKINDLTNAVQSLTDEKGNELLTPKEVCEMLKIGRTTYQRYIVNGTLTPIRINKEKYSKVYVKRAEIEAMINEGTT